MCLAPNGTQTIMTVDHIIPRSLGGSSHDDNLRLMCKHCNSHRGSDITDVFGNAGTNKKVMLRLEELIGKIRNKYMKGHRNCKKLSKKILNFLSCRGLKTGTKILIHDATLGLIKLAFKNIASFTLTDEMISETI